MPHNIISKVHLASC